MKHLGPFTLRAEVEKWPLTSPFHIAGYTFETVDVLLVTLGLRGVVGRGEASGVYYRNDKPGSMLTQIESLRALIEAGISRDELQGLLPPGGARNALDCALWELESKLTGRPVWQLAGLDQPRSLLTTFTCSADDPDKMAAVARNYEGARAIKLKLTGEESDADRVQAVRQALPSVWLGVDANQGLTLEALEKLMPVFVAQSVSLIEQPLAVGQESRLEGFHSPIPIAADESAQSLRDIPGLVGRFNVVNIKLDKCGGLTEGIAMARAARDFGLEPMVGNMIGTSVAMAPAVLVGQLCAVADLDGPIFLRSDRNEAVRYEMGQISCPRGVWGA